MGKSNKTTGGPTGNPNEALKAFAQTRAKTPKPVTSQLPPCDPGAIEPEDEGTEFDPKAPMTHREQRFLQVYFSGEKITREQAARKAGFKSKTKTGLCNAAKRVLNKYDAQTDPREIFRQIGLGEQAIAKKLLAIADDPKTPAGTRVQALSVASKCIGLQREVVESAGGAKIIIEPAAPREASPRAAPTSPGANQAQNPAPATRPSGPISIVK